MSNRREFLLASLGSAAAVFFAPFRRVSAKPKAFHLWAFGDAHFLNVSALSQFHGRHNVPMSRLLTFVEGTKQVRVQRYMHTDQYAKKGWYPKVERALKLSRAFHR